MREGSGWIQGRIGCENRAFIHFLTRFLDVESSRKHQRIVPSARSEHTRDDQASTPEAVVLAMCHIQSLLSISETLPPPFGLVHRLPSPTRLLPILDIASTLLDSGDTLWTPLSRADIGESIAEDC